MTDVYVVAFDPGTTTGWCVMGVDSDELGCNGRVAHTLEIAILHYGQWTWGQIDAGALGSPHGGVGVGRGHDALNFPGENMAVDEMCDLVLCQYPESVVLLEKFVVDPALVKGNFDFVAPVRIISAFSYALHADAMKEPENVVRDPYNRFNLINRGDPKRTCTDERLKHWGFGDVVSHRTRHACDATRIAYYFLRDCRGNSPKAREKRWRAWPHVFPDPAAKAVGKATVAKKPRPLGERI